jgi:hypothetical protein
MGAGLYEIVGVAEERFTGTEAGVVTGIFVPTMMNAWVERANATWVRTLAWLKPGVSAEPVRARLARHCSSIPRGQGEGVHRNVQTAH